MVSPFGGLAREPGLACGLQKVRRWGRRVWRYRGSWRSAYPGAGSGGAGVGEIRYRGRWILLQDSCISPTVAPTADWGAPIDASRRDDHNGIGHASLAPLPEAWWPFEERWKGATRAL
ncbi:uncharacterized protein NECHADRAFT_75810 [Fusarium vanettenii 77-13-4]|uniref:Uncharacterized protein n=1 Tax=Fusarium vanettenii (strain ATCC MYA-4622 / CBS 123669 / FGSC 9596 / NRRL 45880 / 77-13-4) TaxID=660122 RepID=C7Z5N2_FUSV7|nr:uncharacterized protein NECHADRAFT_75810 [Fusarium vanettenii 77-13-4]EEU39980.1 predicted protein [Fusarium vanettenii 77-13-4]